MTDHMLIANINANRAAELEALKAEYRAMIAANDRRLFRALARIAGYAAVVPAVLGAANAAGLI